MVLFYREKLFKQSLSNLKVEVVKANTLVREANYLAVEMGKQTEFHVTLQIPSANLTPNRKVRFIQTRQRALVFYQGSQEGCIIWGMCAATGGTNVSLTETKVSIHKTFSIQLIHEQRIKMKYDSLIKSCFTEQRSHLISLTEIIDASLHCKRQLYNCLSTPSECRFYIAIPACFNGAVSHANIQIICLDLSQ